MAQFIATSGTAQDAGLFIPADNLAGVGAGEFNSDNGALLEGKLIYGFLNSLLPAINENSPLGLTVAKEGTDAGILNTYREKVTLTNQWIVDMTGNSIYPLPIPSTGTYSGTGGLSIADVFPDAALKADNASLTGEGVLIPHTLATLYGGSVPATVNDDGRAWFMGCMGGLCATATLRTATVASAVKATSNLLRSRFTGTTIPDTYYAASNPLTGLNPANIQSLRLIQEALSIEYEFTINPNTQTLEVRVATN